MALSVSAPGDRTFGSLFKQNLLPSGYRKILPKLRLTERHAASLALEFPMKTTIFVDGAGRGLSSEVFQDRSTVNLSLLTEEGEKVCSAL